MQTCDAQINEHFSKMIIFHNIIIYFPFHHKSFPFASILPFLSTVKFFKDVCGAKLWFATAHAQQMFTTQKNGKTLTGCVCVFVKD